MVQNAAAWLVFNQPKRANVTPLFINLHWLPVAARIQHKALTLAYKVTSGSAPIYLNVILKAYITSRALRYFTVFAHCLNTFCSTWLAVPKLYTQAHRTQHLEINHSHLCQIETLQPKPNNPLSKCHSDDKIAHTCILWKHCHISSDTLVYFI